MTLAIGGEYQYVGHDEGTEVSDRTAESQGLSRISMEFMENG